MVDVPGLNMGHSRATPSRIVGKSILNHHVATTFLIHPCTPGI